MANGQDKCQTIAAFDLPRFNFHWAWFWKRGNFCNFFCKKQHPKIVAIILIVLFLQKEAHNQLVLLQFGFSNNQIL